MRTEGREVAVDRAHRTSDPRTAYLTVAVVDENAIFRRGLVTCLETDPAVEVVFEGSAGPLSAPVDVAVASGATANRVRPVCPLVVCSDQPRSVRAALGRRVVVLPRSGLTERQLTAAVRAAASGLEVAAPSRAPSRRPGGISQRSLDTIRLLAAGCGTREISVAVGFSERTVKTVISELQRRLGARTRAQVVAEAIRKGLI